MSQDHRETSNVHPNTLRILMRCTNGDFVLYFQKTYVGQMVNGREIPGIFPYQLWNMHERVKNNLPRTNNSLEGWHNGFATTLPKQLLRNINLSSAKR